MTFYRKEVFLVNTKNTMSFYLFVLFILIQINIVLTVVPNPPPILTYQPPFIETRNFQIQQSETFQYKYTTGGVMTPTNTETGGKYKGDYPITFQRIHLMQPFSFKVAVSLTGLGYVIQWKNISSNSMVYINVKSNSSTSFVVESYMQLHSKFLHMKCRYLAYNPNYLTDFYFHSGLQMVPTNVDFTIGRVQTKKILYSTPSPPNEYNFFFLLQGIDVVIASGEYYIVWKSTLSGFDPTQYKMDLYGQKCFINKLKFTVVFYKSRLQYNAPPIFMHTKVLKLINHSCFGYNTYCTMYNPSITSPQFNVYNNNFFIGNRALAPIWNIKYDIKFNNGIIQSWVDDNNYILSDGFLFYGYICADGYFFDSGLQACTKCPQKCLKCSQLICQYCDIDYTKSLNGKQCISIFIPPQDLIKNCSNYSQKGNQFKCKFCNITKKLYLNNKTFQCLCQDGFQFNKTSQMCQDICGDGRLFQKQCDDGNLNNNDGCDSNCNLQIGFNCVKNISPTVCKSALQLKYKIDMILKIEDRDAGQIILSPTVFDMPFNVIKENFYSQKQYLTHLDLKLILKNNSVENTYDLNFQLQKVQNNKIYLYFQYNFTVQKLDARIYLDYQYTNYMPTNQTLDFELTGLNGKFQFTSYYAAYGSVSKGIQIATILGLLALVAGLILPKFIGIQTIVTLQLIFYSQILIYQPEDWPIGFLYLKYLKIATGYNDFIFLTSYFQLTNITKRFSIINLKKTIIENFNLNFVIVIFFALCFYLAALIRSKKQTQIETYIKVNKIQDAYRNSAVKRMLKKFRIPLKINEIMYWIISQLCIWSVLPIMSSIGAQFMIQNSMISLIEGKYDSIFLKLRGIQFFIILFVVLSIVLNHFKNAFLSRKTLKKIKERPQQLFYKQLLFIYLFVMGGLIFFFNDVKLNVIPISVIILVLHTIYAVSLLFIQPYKQSLRIHAFTLYMNQVLYGVFLIVINFINLVGNFDQTVILYIGYAITGWVVFLILMTFVRLYYEIRYGEDLEKKIQAQRLKKEQQQERRRKKLLQKKIDAFQKQAKQKLTKLQQRRDMNTFLLETQQKQMERKNLLEWLEGKNWQQQEKERYFFREHHEKPLEWIKSKDSDQFKKRMAEIQVRKETIQEKNKKRKQDPEYIEITTKMRDSLEAKKKLLKSFKKEAKRKKEQNKWNKPNY